MDLENDNDETVVNEDRLSTLPDELIHKILSCFDTKFAVQTSLLSPRWKILWTSMPYLSFSCGSFSTLPKFAKFVKHVLIRRNHNVEVSSVKLSFRGAASQVFVRKIADYAFAHNVQKLTVSCSPENNREFPPCFFNSPSLQHFTFNGSWFFAPCVTPKTPWDYPALTTLHLKRIKLCDNNTKQPLDLFSKCVNLKNLTLEDFNVEFVEVFDIIAPQLFNLKLSWGRRLKGVNLIAPQLENLTITHCSIDYLNLDVPPGLSSFSYRDYRPLVFPKYRFKSLNKGNVFLYIHKKEIPYTVEVGREVINMLQKLRTARYLTLNIDIVECLSAFPDLLSHIPSPFSNLISLTIDSSERKDTYDFKLSTEARNFLLEKSPNSTFIMDLPPSKAMLQKEARARKKAKVVAEVESHMKEFHTSLERRKNLHIEKNGVKEKTKAALAKLSQEATAWAEKKRETQMLVVDQGKSKTYNENVPEKQVDTEREELVAGIKGCVEEMRGLVEQQEENVVNIRFEKKVIDMLLEKLPKGQRADIEKRYSRELQEYVQHSGDFVREIVCFNVFIDGAEKIASDIMLQFQDVANAKIFSASPPPPPSLSSSSKTVGF